MSECRRPTGPGQGRLAAASAPKKCTDNRMKTRKYRLIKQNTANKHQDLGDDLKLSYYDEVSYFFPYHRYSPKVR